MVKKMYVFRGRFFFRLLEVLFWFDFVSSNSSAQTRTDNTFVNMHVHMYLSKATKDLFGPVSL